TEWTNYTGSDVFYCPTNRAKTKERPPVLIEQYTANGVFSRRLIEYFRSKYLLIKASRVRTCTVTVYEFHVMVTIPYEMPFCKRVHCQGWAQECYFISSATISDYLDQKPLHPLAALGHFFAEQKLSILDRVRKNDPTFKLLYGIAQSIR
ncbi:hypothetical protein BDB01DRAFT_729348, partial [Pilobolus umbonatus]